jgi:hypothetical protein
MPVQEKFTCDSFKFEKLKKDYINLKHRNRSGYFGKNTEDPVGTRDGIVRGEFFTFYDWATEL